MSGAVGPMQSMQPVILAGAKELMAGQAQSAGIQVSAVPSRAHSLVQFVVCLRCNCAISGNRLRKKRSGKPTTVIAKIASCRSINEFAFN